MTSQFFDDPDADLILRSSSPNAVDFGVHRCVLSAASPFFRQMFKLPQPPSSESGIPSIEVAEPHTTLESLLRFVYPFPNPPIDSLDQLVLVLGAAVKYDMASVVDALRTLLVAPVFVTAAPIRVYAIASRFDLEEEAKIASQHTLGVKVLDSPLHEDLKHITAYSYHRLLDLHNRRAKAAQELLRISDEVKCMKCNGGTYGAFCVPKWWRDFEERAKAELRARPTSEIIFSLAFLSRSAQAGCERCAGSVLDAHQFLQDLRERIDSLPSTI